MKLALPVKLLIVGMAGTIAYFVFKGRKSAATVATAGGPGAPAATPAVVAAQTAAVSAPASAKYTVQAGDGTMQMLARKFSVSLASLQMLNPEIKSPNLTVPPGTVLVIPGGAKRTTSSGMGTRLTSRPYVVWVQTSLNSIISANLSVTGMQDPLTTAMVMRYQTARGLRADGVVGERTEMALVADGASPPPAV